MSTCIASWVLSQTLWSSLDMQHRDQLITEACCDWHSWGNYPHISSCNDGKHYGYRECPKLHQMVHAGRGVNWDSLLKVCLHFIFSWKITHTHIHTYKKQIHLKWEQYGGHGQEEVGPRLLLLWSGWNAFCTPWLGKFPHQVFQVSESVPVSFWKSLHLESTVCLLCVHFCCQGIAYAGWCEWPYGKGSCLFSCLQFFLSCSRKPEQCRSRSDGLSSSRCSGSMAFRL